jgi:hypothetical protein
MKDKTILGIIDLCIAINQKAFQIYTRLSEEVNDTHGHPEEPPCRKLVPKVEV